MIQYIVHYSFSSFLNLWLQFVVVLAASDKTKGCWINFCKIELRCKRREKETTISPNSSQQSSLSLFQISKWFLCLLCWLLMMTNCLGTTNPTGQPSRQPTTAPSSTKQCSVGGYVASGICSLVPAGNTRSVGIL